MSYTPLLRSLLLPQFNPLPPASAAVTNPSPSHLHQSSSSTHTSASPLISSTIIASVPTYYPHTQSSHSLPSLTTSTALPTPPSSMSLSPLMSLSLPVHTSSDARPTSTPSRPIPTTPTIRRRPGLPGTTRRKRHGPPPNTRRLSISTTLSTPHRVPASPSDLLTCNRLSTTYTPDMTHSRPTSGLENSARTDLPPRNGIG